MKTKWVYCDQHGAPHRLNGDGTCWCTVLKNPPDYGAHAVVLETQSEDPKDVVLECKERGLWIYSPSN